MIVSQLSRTEIYQIKHSSTDACIHVELIFYGASLQKSRIRPPNREDFGFYDSDPDTILVIGELIIAASKLIKNERIKAQCEI